VTDAVFAQAIGICSAVLLLSAVLLVWRRAQVTALPLLALQGLALAGLVAVMAIDEGSPELFGLALTVLFFKAIAIPLALARAGRGEFGGAPLINTATSLIAMAALTALAYAVSAPLSILGTGPTVQAIPVGIALVLFGFLLLVTGRHAIAQLIGFLVIDNGTSAVAFLSSGGVSIIVELGVFLDVLLVVLILYVLTGRIRDEYGAADLDDLTELHD
jgi:hydrogenase-4 component E